MTADRPVDPLLPTGGGRVRRMGAAEFRLRVGELLDVYISAMRYPPQTRAARSALWAEHSGRPAFDCLVAIGPQDEIHGLAYGYRGLPGQWWHTEVSRGLPASAGDWLDDYFELTELHVHPDHQGHRTGEQLLRALASGVPCARMLLSTPEGENRAWRLYRRTGFVDLLRDYRFTGDQRPFGVLGRVLPLAAPDAG